MLNAGPSPANTLRAAVADVADLDRHRCRVNCRCTMMLNASTAGGRCFPAARARRRRSAAGTGRRRHRRERRRRRALREVEHAVEVLGAFSSWTDEHRQVLRHAVAEERAEHADVVASAVPARRTVFSSNW